MAATSQEMVRAARKASPALSVTSLQVRAFNLFDVAARLARKHPTADALLALEMAGVAHNQCYHLVLGARDLQAHVDEAVSTLRRAADTVAELMVRRGTSEQAVAP